MGNKAVKVLQDLEWSGQTQGQGAYMGDHKCTGAGMMEAKKHFMDAYYAKKKAEMVKLIESGTLEDIRKVVSILVEKF